jgi:hypothetical protein
MAETANGINPPDASVRSGSRLPPLTQRELPPSVPLKSMLGPSMLMLAASLGSGEFVIFPSVTLDFGFVMMWAAWVGFLTQYVINMEIERYTLACGETITTGFGRLWTGWAWIMLACNIICWAWPGWSTGAAACLQFLFGFDDSHVKYYSVAALILIGLALSLGPVIYKTTIAIQSALVVLIFLFMIVVACFMFRADAVGDFIAGVFNVGHIPENIELGRLMTVLSFAGAGGTINLCQSNYIREMRYGMSAFVGRLRSPITGGLEPIATTGFYFKTGENQMPVWRRWWRSATVEHFLTFVVLGVASIFILSFLAHCANLTDSQTIADSRPRGPTDFGFINGISIVIGNQLGAWARWFFLLMGAAILLTTALGILDATSRVSADIVKMHVPAIRDSERTTESLLYLFFLWGEIALGVTILLVGFTKPFTLLVLSGSLNLISMAIYSGLLIYMNWSGSIHRSISMSWWRYLAMFWAFGLYAYFSGRFLWAKLAGLFSI